jgi:hypothetical protein
MTIPFTRSTVDDRWPRHVLFRHLRQQHLDRRYEDSGEDAVHIVG